MRPLFLLAVLSLTCQLQAQSTLADLKARLVKQPLYLRGRWRDDKLFFDTSGQLIGTSAPTTFTIAGIEIRSVDLKADRLILKGRRAGLEFKHDQPKRVVIDKEAVQIEIAAPPAGDYTVPLERILTPKLPDLLLAVPSYWLPFVQQHLLPSELPHAPGAAGSSDQMPSSRSSRPGPDAPSAAQPFKVGGSVTAPRLVVQAEPQFSPQARSMQYAATVLVQLVVDANGDPSHPVILRPAGLELDERALAAVAHYKFVPATSNGRPVPVEVNIDINFQIF